MRGNCTDHVKLTFLLDWCPVSSDEAEASWHVSTNATACESMSCRKHRQRFCQLLGLSKQLVFSVCFRLLRQTGGQAPAVSCIHKHRRVYIQVHVLMTSLIKTSVRLVIVAVLQQHEASGERWNHISMRATWPPCDRKRVANQQKENSQVFRV